MLLGVSAIVAITLFPSGGAERLPFWCLACGERPGVDLLLNILLFVPFGAGMGAAGFRFRRALVLSLALTIAIEALQLFVLPGRFPSGRDLLANGMGGALGWTLGHGWGLLVYPSLRSARVLGVATITAWLGSQAFATWALVPAPPEPPWWSQIRPRFERYPHVFGGRIVDVAVGPVSINSNDSIAEVDRARAALLDGEALRAVVVADWRSQPDISPIVIVSAGPSADVALLGRYEDGVVFGARVRAAEVGLRTPLVSLSRVRPRSRDDPVALSGSYAEGRYWLLAESMGEVRERRLSASASWSWSLLLPMPTYAFGSEVHLWTALWLVLGIAPAMYWVASALRGTRRFRAILPAMLTGAVALGLAGIPVAGGLPVAHWSEWVGALFGVVVGWLAERATAKSRVCDAA
jgi:hypothetical protein